MSPEPTGALVATDDGVDLVLVRTFTAEIADVWASITESAQTELWFASWTGEPRVGGTIRYRLTFEGEAPEEEMRIDACDPPMHLAVTAGNDEGSWRLEARLTESEGVTRLTFVQHLDPEADVGSIGPGWEYYLDLLAASRDGLAAPDFDDYYPSQQAHYEGLAEQLRRPS